MRCSIQTLGQAIEVLPPLEVLVDDFVELPQRKRFRVIDLETLVCACTIFVGGNESGKIVAKTEGFERECVLCLGKYMRESVVRACFACIARPREIFRNIPR